MQKRLFNNLVFLGKLWLLPSGNLQGSPNFLQHFHSIYLEKAS